MQPFPLKCSYDAATAAPFENLGMTFAGDQDDPHELPRSVQGRLTEQLSHGHDTSPIRSPIRSSIHCQDSSYENIRLHRNNADGELVPEGGDWSPSTRNGPRP